ncbi:MAG: DUF2959 domain-containing protein [Opitutaceae bacterium]|nr:DUF2959 domain-containing protein [Opitutaceae bacterium]
MNKRPFLHLGLIAVCLVLMGCQSIYYSAWEKLGVEKRELLRKRVVAARDEQKEAGEQFKDAMTRLKEITGFDGGKLEKAYSELKGDFDGCTSRSEAVRKRIKDMETVAEDLFAEWEKEIGQYSSATLQANSRHQLQATRQRYQGLHTALKNAEQAMAPVLAQFKDYVLYLKHNLNAQAIASLRGEATNIQAEISKLIAQMNQSIAKADEFVKTMP